MDDAILDSLSVPTGDVGWPQLGDWLYDDTVKGFEHWICVNSAYEYPDRPKDGPPDKFCIDYTFDNGSGHYWVELEEGPKGFARIYPHHVPTMKLLAELKTYRDRHPRLAEFKGEI